MKLFQTLIVSAWTLFISASDVWNVNADFLTMNLTFTKPIVNKNETAAFVQWQK